MKKIALLLFTQIAWFESFAAVGGAAAMPGGGEVELRPAVGGAGAPVALAGAPIDVISPVRLYSIDKVNEEGFSERLRTSISVVALANDADDADGYCGGCGYGSCGKYNGTALAFKVSLPEDRDKVLWYMSIRFSPEDSYSIAVLDSKVEAKIFYSPDTYRSIYGVDFSDKSASKYNRSGKAKPFFKITDGLRQEIVTNLKSRTIFEWPVEKKFPVDTFEATLRGSVAAGREFNHVTPRDIINGLNTLRTRPSAGDPIFPFYTLRGIDYYHEAINCCGFCTRALNAFGLPIHTSSVLSAYLNHDYAATYRWYKLGRLAFMTLGPSNLTPDRFIQEIRKLFLDKDGVATRGFREGDRETLKTFFPLAY